MAINADQVGGAALRRKAHIVIPDGSFLVTTPNDKYDGFTANVEFVHGRALIDDEYAQELGFKDALTLAYLLQEDFQYTIEPPLPTRMRPQGGGLAKRFEEVLAREGGSAIAPSGAVRFCTYCGNDNGGQDLAEWRFCASCGKPAARATQTTPAQGDDGRTVPFYPRKDIAAGADPKVAIPVVSKLHEREEIKPAQTGEENTNGSQEGQGEGNQEER